MTAPTGTSATPRPPVGPSAPRFPVPWRASPAAPRPVRLQLADDLEDLLADGGIDYQQAARSLVAATYALSGGELSRVIAGTVRLLRGGPS
jgi:hypothetical protein